ncbi:hypothetical protein MD273_03060 [Marinobacter pelagius]|uniref:hypothetical protein n=1 Tax=Marinobacter sp. C7 TaxID=2951363 RepID=UPI001EF10A9D|nr:hypothetical protein [Marinobacter sp. C7]MCG7198698.1 hypothetical protein [Marinobacter sp. C7]
MKLKNLSKWNLDNKLEPLLFFAQRMDELLFQYSLDSYKPPCLNSPFLVREALTVVEEVENGVLDESAIKTVIEELRWSLASDFVAKREIGVNFDYFIIDVDNAKVKDVKVRLELLSHKLKPQSYLRSALIALKQSVEKKRRKKLIFWQEL